MGRFELERNSDEEPQFHFGKEETCKKPQERSLVGASFLTDRRLKEGFLSLERKRKRERQREHEQVFDRGSLFWRGGGISLPSVQFTEEGGNIATDGHC